MSIKSQLARQFGLAAENIFVLSSPGGNYSEDFPRALSTFNSNGVPCGFVFMLSHEGCKADAAGLRTESRQAAPKIVAACKREGIPIPQLWVGNVEDYRAVFCRFFSFVADLSQVEYVLFDAASANADQNSGVHPAIVASMAVTQVGS